MRRWVRQNVWTEKIWPVFCRILRWFCLSWIRAFEFTKRDEGDRGWEIRLGGREWGWFEVDCSNPGLLQDLCLQRLMKNSKYSWFKFPVREKNLCVLHWRHWDVNKRVQCLFYEGWTDKSLRTSKLWKRYCFDLARNVCKANDYECFALFEVWDVIIWENKMFSSSYIEGIIELSTAVLLTSIKKNKFCIFLMRGNYNCMTGQYRGGMCIKSTTKCTLRHCFSEHKQYRL